MIEMEENKVCLECEESLDEDFDGRKDDGSLLGFESDDVGLDVEGVGKKWKGDEVVELDEDEVKVLLEDLGIDVREGKWIWRSDVNGFESEENGMNVKEGLFL